MSNPASAESQPNTVVKWKMDEDYPDVVILVEDILFRSSKRKLAQESKVIEKLLSPPQFPGSLPKGSSEKNPVVLEGMTCIEFRSLLRFVDPSRADAKLAPSLMEWQSILRLSTKWECHRIRNIAIKRMKSLVDAKLSPFDKALLALECHVPDWVVEGYDALVRRDTPLTEQEAQALGLSTATRLFQETFRCWQAGHRSAQDSSGTSGLPATSWPDAERVSVALVKFGAGTFTAGGEGQLQVSVSGKNKDKDGDAKSDPQNGAPSKPATRPCNISHVHALRRIFRNELFSPSASDELALVVPGKMDVASADI